MIVVFRKEHDSCINDRCKSVEEEESCIGTDCIDISNGVALDGGCDERSVEARASESLSGIVCMSRGSIGIYEEFASVGLKEGTGE